MESRYVFGFDEGVTPYLAFTANQRPVVAGGDQLVSAEVTSSRLGCLNDSADSRYVAHIAPGQLLSLFGFQLASTENAWGGTRFPTSLGGIHVEVDGVSVPLLFTSAGQVNFQVPFEISGRDSVSLKLTTADGTLMNRVVRVVPRAPSAFLTTPYVSGASVNCAGLAPALAAAALILNEDGSQNGCENPARPGSRVTAFLNGLGDSSQSLKTGEVNSDTEGLTSPSVTLAKDSGFTLISARPAPGLISGVWRLDARVPAIQGSLSLVPLVDGQTLPSPKLLVWVAQ